MDKPQTSRRNFLKLGGSAVGTSWLALNTSLILSACQVAQSNRAEKTPFANISTAQTAELEAIVDQIIPADETPGATDTGVVYFIDVALGGFMAGNKESLQQGLQDLASRANSMSADGSLFSELSFDQQTILLKEIEETEFFDTLYFLTMMGMFCLPQYSGNHDEIGWALLGFDHQHVWQAPFGYYDAALHESGVENGNS